MKTLTTVENLQAGDVVEVAANTPPYVVIKVEESLQYDPELETSGTYCLVDGKWHVLRCRVILENSQDVLTLTSGLVYLLGKLPQVTFYQNGSGTIHATIDGIALCGHRFTSNSRQVRQEPTCESCKALLRR